uniref:Actin maturation protease n=1 Tax=Salmo trutta TaxID=8032 RepID=A0A673ZWA9_SALTR
MSFVGSFVIKCDVILPKVHTLCVFVCVDVVWWLYGWQITYYSPLSVSMETIVQTTMDRGYTPCACVAELLSGGMSGDNSTAILKHLADGQPVLIPDPLFCHIQAVRKDPSALVSVLLGLDQDNVSREYTQSDPTLPWLLLPQDSPSCPCPCPTVEAREAYVLAKQGKSLRYQLWSLDKVAQSNAQLREIDPQRAGDCTQCVVPKGGVEAGLAGQVVLLHTGGQT